ncbi:hypothetical protein WN48_09667 [Eufriesea mexicana]|uniref:Uncharacterized protein n=1 Tax=Eufriesea mexicana TaxID=516756 RepID=A0A310S741_9HYME|nr:hypothetical protein WN48_09667 [Eufriesea mexicana]
MSITSDTMYNARTVAPSFISSNMHYDCIPRYKKNHQNVMFEHIEITKPSLFNCYSYDTLMETDEDECDYSIASGYLNNDSIILEASVQNRLKANNKLQLQQPATYGADVLQCRNRKRRNSDLNPTNQLKKDGGKDYVQDGMGSTKDYGSTTVLYKPEALHVNTIDNNMEQSMVMDKNCCWSGNNHDILKNTNYETLLFNSGQKSIENTIEYEKILFETHGCSIYQFHRLQLISNDGSEAEF